MSERSIYLKDTIFVQLKQFDTNSDEWHFYLEA